MDELDELDEFDELDEWMNIYIYLSITTIQSSLPG